jgi:hypothetical protein
MKYSKCVKIIGSDKSVKRKDIIELFKKCTHPHDDAIKITNLKTLENIQRFQKYESKRNWFIIFSSNIKVADLHS